MINFCVAHSRGIKPEDAKRSAATSKTTRFWRSRAGSHATCYDFEQQYRGMKLLASPMSAKYMANGQKNKFFQPVANLFRNAEDHTVF